MDWIFFTFGFCRMREKLLKIVFGMFLFPLTSVAEAQYSQQLRGTVVELVLQTPLAGATVSIKSLGKSVVTDEVGIFRFKDLPTGNYHIDISYTGCKDVSLDNILINAGKETLINVSLETIVRMESEVVV